MAEPDRRGETYRAGSAMTFGGVTLVVVERTVAQAAGCASGRWCWTGKAPHALVIQDGGGVRAVDADGAPVPLDLLRRAVPGLDALLASLPASRESVRAVRA